MIYLIWAIAIIYLWLMYQIYTAPFMDDDIVNDDDENYF